MYNLGYTNPMKINKKKKKQKWRFSKNAFAKRYCERCSRKLKLSEVKICNECYTELIDRNGGNHV